MVFLIFCESYDDNNGHKFTVKGFNNVLFFFFFLVTTHRQTELLNVAVLGGIFRVNSSRRCSHIIKKSATECSIKKR